MTKEELRQRRVALGLTQEKLAHALGITRQTVYSWERGDTKIPGFLQLAMDQLEQLNATGDSIDEQ